MAPWPTVESKGIEVGQRWAIRLGNLSDDRAAEVEVVRIGVRRPPRVRVVFCDDEYEGRREWVAVNRLTVPWSSVEGWIENQRNWQAVADRSKDADAVELDAVYEVFGALDPMMQTLRIYNDGAIGPRETERRRGVLRVDSSTIDALRIDLPAPAFRDGDHLVYDFAAARALAARLALQRSNQLAEDIHRCIREDYEPGLIRYNDDPRMRHYYETQMEAARLVLSWCDEQATAEFDEIAALRKELNTKRRQLERTIKTMLNDARYDRRRERRARYIASQVEVNPDTLHFTEPYE